MTPFPGKLTKIKKQIFNQRLSQALPLKIVSKDLAILAIKTRNAIEDFVNSEERSVSWQEEYITRTSYEREGTTNEHEF